MYLLYSTYPKPWFAFSESTFISIDSHILYKLKKCHFWRIIETSHFKKNLEQESLSQNSYLSHNMQSKLISQILQNFEITVLAVVVFYGMFALPKRQQCKKAQNAFKKQHGLQKMRSLQKKSRYTNDDLPRQLTGEFQFYKCTWTLLLLFWERAFYFPSYLKICISDFAVHKCESTYVKILAFLNSTWQLWVLLCGCNWEKMKGLLAF